MSWLVEESLPDPPRGVFARYEHGVLEVAMPPGDRFVPAGVAAVMSAVTLGLIALVMVEQIAWGLGAAGLIVAGFAVYGVFKPAERFRVDQRLQVPELAGEVRAWFDQLVLRAVRIPRDALLADPPLGVVVLEDALLVDGQHVSLQPGELSVQHVEDNPPVHGLRVGAEQVWVTELSKLYWLARVLSIP